MFRRDFHSSDTLGLLSACAMAGLLLPPESEHFAKIALSTMLSDVRKKAGTVVHQAGRMGLVVRKHSIPRQPRSVTQRVVRGNFGTNAQDWGATLTQAERDAWTAFASTLTITDRLGRKFVPTGIQLYQRISRNLHTIALAPLTSPPADQLVSSPLALTVVCTTGGTVLTVDASSEPAAGEVPVVFSAAPVSPGISVPGKKLRYTFKAAAATAGPWNILATYTALFGAPVVGKKLFVGVEYINNTTGARSGLVTGSVIAS